MTDPTDYLEGVIKAGRAWRVGVSPTNPIYITDNETEARRLADSANLIGNKSFKAFSHAEYLAYIA